MPNLLIQVLREPREGHVPGDLGSGGVIRSPVIAKESMTCSLEDLDLADLLEPLQGLVYPPYLVHRDHLVALAEEA
jgi:hypothetical protein